MITNTSPDEFPCIEATRCLVTEKEMGMRLTVKYLQNNIGHKDDLQNQHVVTFSKERKTTEEWYLHLDFARCDGGKGEPRRVLQLRHSETGQYLASDDKGRVVCTSTSSPSTYWWMILSTSSSTSSSSLAMSDSSSATDEQYILMSKEHAPRRLTYTTTTKGLAESSEDFQLITSKNSGEPSTWELKFTSGELCFVSNPVMHCNIRCNLLGQLSLNSGLNGWEVFRFIEVGNGELYISSWTHFSKFLSSNSDGEVCVIDSSSNSLGYGERWRLEPAPSSNGVYIKNVASLRYLSVGRGKNEALWTTTKPNAYALWHLNAAHSHIYYLTSLFASIKKTDDVDGDGDGDGIFNTEGAMKNLTSLFTSIKKTNDVDSSINTENVKDVVKTENTAANDYNQIYSKHGISDMHVSSRKGAPFLTKNKRKLEEWKVEVTPDGYVTFFSIVHEKYLGCNSKGDVHTTTSKGAWCFFEKQESPNDGVMFLSKEHQRYLAVNEEDGSLCTTDGNEETNLKNSWRLDPRLPRSVSGGKIAGAMGLAITIAMPFAVLGAIEAAGATITQIALLGGVSVEALASVGAGVGIGVGMVGTTAALMPNDANIQSDGVTMTTDLPKVYNFVAQRPISGWKSWANHVSQSPSKPPNLLSSSPTSVAITSDIPHIDVLEKGALISPSDSVDELQSKKHLIDDESTTSTNLTEIRI